MDILGHTWTHTDTHGHTRTGNSHAGAKHAKIKEIENRMSSCGTDDCLRLDEKQKRDESLRDGWLRWMNSKIKP